MEQKSTASNQPQGGSKKLAINVRKLEKLEPTGPEPRPTGG